MGIPDRLMLRKMIPSDKQLTVQLATAREASIVLRLSTRSLHRLRTQGILRAGECWVRKFPTNPSSDVLYDIPACLHALNAATIAAQVEQDCLGQPKVELA